MLQLVVSAGHYYLMSSNDDLLYFGGLLGLVTIFLSCAAMVVVWGLHEENKSNSQPHLILTVEERESMQRGRILLLMVWFLGAWVEWCENAVETGTWLSGLGGV